MSSPRVFTVGEVDALIPELSQLVGRQLERQNEVEQSLAELARAAGGLPRAIDPDPADTPEVASLKAVLRERVTHYDEGWRDVQALGAVVKDPQIGLVDFYGRIEGRLVWLCWRFGEETLRYYHELTDGYAGRMPLRPETRGRLVN